MGENKNNPPEGEKDKPVIDRQTAEKEFDNYCEANDIDCDMNAMTDDEKKDFEPIRKRFVKACMQGRVKVDGTDLKYTVSKFSKSPFGGQEITIKRCGGQSFIGMDGFKDTQSIHKMNGFLSAMTGQEISYFTKIDGKDWQFFRDIATLFLVD
jgi:hypothetical protein